MPNPHDIYLNKGEYEFDYYSGSQIGVYIGDILLDDCQHIQFSVGQSKRPIYGYASQYFHTVAAGQILVEGSFTVPFKEADYVIATIARYRDKIPPITSVKRGKRTIYNVAREDIERFMQNEGKNSKQVNRFSGGSPITMSAGGGSNRYKLYRDLAAMPDEAFENLAEKFEDVLWKHPETNFDLNNIVSSSTVDDMRYRRADQYPSFDIWVLYGDISNPAANHTIKKIEGVHVTGQGQTLMADGEPIAETYQFFARNQV